MAGERRSPANFKFTNQRSPVGNHEFTIINHQSPITNHLVSARYSALACRNVRTASALAESPSAADATDFTSASSRL
jgi:hypothetical protein